ncbi:MAG: protein BatD [Sphingobacteriales bacterium]|nr:protein BatD [Sphingobacteriales bacterium]
MRPKIKLIYLLTLILAGFSFGLKAQTIQVEAKLDTTSIPLGDQTQLHLSVRFPAGSVIEFPLLKDSIAGKLQLVSTNKADTSFNKDDVSIQTIRQSYTLTSFDPGTYQIPSFIFKIKTDSFKTVPLTLQVTSVAIDTTKGIYDIKQPLAVSYTFADWLKDNWHWIALALVLISSIVGILYYLKKRSKNKPAVMEVKDTTPAHVLALNKLSALRDKKLWQNNLVKDYYSELSDILREYLEKRYAIKTHEQTTEEIFLALKYKDLDVSSCEILRQILVLADLVKFAKEKPLPADNEKIMDDAVRFVTQTQNTFSQTTAERNGLV